VIGKTCGVHIMKLFLDKRNKTYTSITGTMIHVTNTRLGSSWKRKVNSSSHSFVWPNPSRIFHRYGLFIKTQAELIQKNGEWTKKVRNDYLTL
jgi:hypothetical protein